MLCYVIFPPPLDSRDSPDLPHLKKEINYTTPKTLTDIHEVSGRSLIPRPDLNKKPLRHALGSEFAEKTTTLQYTNAIPLFTIGSTRDSAIAGTGTQTWDVLR